MYRNEFLSSAAVINFIDWISVRLDKPDSFIHEYHMKKPSGDYYFNSIYSAFENYYWNFKTEDPLSGETIEGRSFYDSMYFIEKLSEGLKTSIARQNNHRCKELCFSILKWGGVSNNNSNKIDKLDDDIVNYFENVINTFKSNKALSEYYSDEIFMNSGFSKIYSFCMDDFIIYDGRVGSALGYLVRKFCEDKLLDEVPEELSFAWGRGREYQYKGVKENRRNPGNNKYKFSELGNNQKRHTENNIKANWLLREILSTTDSKFNKVDEKFQLRALETALFMIGYRVNF